MGKVLACADLHGMLHLWRQIQEFCDKDDIIYVLGDAADRGPDSWETLKEVLRDPRVKYVRGNHDQMMLDATNEEEYYGDSHVWFSNGGYITYDQMMQDGNYNSCLHHLSKQPFKREYIRADGTKIYLTHAGFTTGTDPHYSDLIWDRDHWDDAAVEDTQNWVVCGHTPIPHLVSKYDMWANESQTVARKGNKICIDAGCFVTNKIALLDLDTFEEVVFYG